MSYTNGCDGAGGFKDKSQKIFDPQLTGSVINQLCYDDGFEHRNHVPVDCTKGVAVGGWSQGAHVASLAGNYAGSLITAGLFWGNGACRLYLYLFLLVVPLLYTLVSYILTHLQFNHTPHNISCDQFA